jgi:DNA/RNA endonuclease YhcR with UshA esterase domain
MSDSISTGHLPIRVFQYSTIGLAIAGVALLIAAAQRVGVPQVENIAAIGITMNMAYVRVAGEVVSNPRYDPETQYLSFTIADESGEMLVTSYKTETETLIAQGKMPQWGDQVVLEGNVRLREESASLSLQSAEHSIVTHQPSTPSQIAAIGTQSEGQRIEITGVVRQVRTPYSGLNIYTVRDATGEIEVAISDDLKSLTDTLPILAAGDSVRLSGLVTVYRNSPQLTVTDGKAIVALDESIALAPQYNTGSVSPDLEGQLVQISGILAEPEAFSAGQKVLIDDGSGAVLVLLWQNVVDELGGLQAGATVQVVGEVSVYKGQVEIIPSSSADVRTSGIALANQPSTPPANASISTATPSTPAEINLVTAATRKGQMVTVNGDVTKSESYAGGFKLTLQDESGTLVLLLPTELYRTLNDLANLRTGASVQATGEIGEYQGIAQLQPSTADEILLLKPAPAVSDSPFPIGDIQLEDINAVLTISGEITEISEFSAGHRLTVRDASGEIQVVIWNNVWEFVPNADKLVVGSTVRVTGLVGEFRGNMQIVPQLGFDVAQE